MCHLLVHFRPFCFSVLVSHSIKNIWCVWFGSSILWCDCPFLLRLMKHSNSTKHWLAIYTCARVKKSHFIVFNKKKINEKIPNNPAFLFRHIRDLYGQSNPKDGKQLNGLYFLQKQKKKDIVRILFWFDGEPIAMCEKCEERRRSGFEFFPTISRPNAIHLNWW